MNKDLINDICDIEYKFTEISNLIKVLKDAVENNEDACYLLNFVEIIDKKIFEFADFLENYNQKVGKIAVK